MKKIVGLLIMSIVALTIGCSKQSNGTTQKANVTFYRHDAYNVYKDESTMMTLSAASGGVYGMYVADNKDVFVLAKNGDLYKNTSLLSTYAMPTSNTFSAYVFYVNGNDIYIGGSEAYTDPIYGNHFRPVIFKNGSKQIMFNKPGETVVGSATRQYVSSIYISGSNVYAAGLAHINTITINGVMIPPSFMLWKNGVFIKYSNALTLDNKPPFVIPATNGEPQMMYLEKTASSMYLLHLLSGGQNYNAFDPLGQIRYDIASRNGTVDIVYNRLLTGADYKADIITTRNGKIGGRSFAAVYQVKCYLSASNDEYVWVQVKELDGTDKTIMFKNGIDYTPPAYLTSFVTLL